MKLSFFIPLILIPTLIFGVVAVRAESPKSERAEREKRFIMDLLTFEGTPEDEMGHEDELTDPINLADMEPYTEGVFVIPGDQLQYKFVNSNRFLSYDTIPNRIVTSKGLEVDKFLKKLKFLYDPRYPKESLANLMVIPLDEAVDVPVKLSILTHDFRSKANLDTTVDKLISYCQYAGCSAFIGFEKPRPGGETPFSLFMVNEDENYIHVFRFECDAVAVINDNAPISGKVSLFIPTDNIENLFQDMPEGKSRAMIEYENNAIQ